MAFPNVIQDILTFYSSAWSFSTNLLNRRSMCCIQRQDRLPAHENKQFTAISYSLALFLLVINTLLHYFRIIDKRNLSRWSPSSLVLKQNYTAAKQSSYLRLHTYFLHFTFYYSIP